MGRFDNRLTRKIRQRRSQSARKARFKTAAIEHRRTHPRARLDTVAPLAAREIRKTLSLEEILGITPAETEGEGGEPAAA